MLLLKHIILHNRRCWTLDMCFFTDRRAGFVLLLLLSCSLSSRVDWASQLCFINLHPLIENSPDEERYSGLYLEYATHYLPRCLCGLTALFPAHPRPCMQIRESVEPLMTEREREKETGCYACLLWDSV